MKYKVELGAFVSRLVTRKIIIHADSEEEAIGKAKDKYHEIESNLANGGMVDSVNVDFIEKL